MDIERTISMPIVNPDTGGTSRSFVFMGVLDQRDGSRIVDWKGCSRPDRALTRLAIGFQAELYALAERHAGHSILEIEYRLIMRPALQYTPPKFTYAVMRPGRKTAVKVCKTREEAQALGDEPPSHPGDWVEKRVQGDATCDVYEERCFDQLVTDPWRMLTHSYILTPAKLRQAEWFLWECSKRILDSRRNNRWIPNTGACFAYERECSYKPLCEVLQNGADYEWIINQQYCCCENCHPELTLDSDSTPSGILTYSSLADLTSCEMFYYWKFERCLRRGDTEDSEPLWVGSAMHRGVARYAKYGGDDTALEMAFGAIDNWARENPVLGENAAWKQDEQIARARAMVRAAAVKWTMTP